METEEQLALLRSQGCPEIQGFLLGRPMLPEAVPEYVAERTRAAALARTAALA